MAGQIVAAVIPCYRVRDRLGAVLAAIGPECDLIYVVDDHCPEESFRSADTTRDPRLRIVRREVNGGVGAAALDGMTRALQDGAAILVKLDGDGQMNPADIARLIRPIVEGRADFVKGNRFSDPRNMGGMPAGRLIGNILLSFAAKASTGYWNLFDPTNGFFAIHAMVFAMLPKDRIARRYFFESDLLYRLGTLRACVIEIPVRPVYADEQSSLRPVRQILPFAAGHIRNAGKRIAYAYFLRNFGPASILLVVGLLLTGFGILFGLSEWVSGIRAAEFASAGTVMLAALPVIIGVQCLLAFLILDTLSMPRHPIHRDL
ncbi:glycosyltransferase family 2 protein [Anianabacter salinae]|uniref:glycosyltransferase family 2 protein n=1 Tax=Anianabacter salinae TaxID=2851023 RepID=UPI00225E1206|nr:glycosyltransferase family 2 protein [Anianabacter salinae]MBV0913456.1 glycosyltransferase family 2 protein [Anianabacter salinae]